MINEGRHADEHVRSDFPDKPEVPLGPHDLAAARAGDKNPERNPAVVRLPESEMGRVRKHVQGPHFASRAANFKEPASGEREIEQIVLGEKERDRVGRAPGGAGHENGPELGLQTPFRFVAAMPQRAQNRRRPPREDVGVGSQDEITRPLRMIRRIEQVGFGSERQPLQIFERPDRIRGETVLPEQITIMRREWQHDPAQVMPQLIRLQPANGFFRQRLPFGFKQPGVHATMPVCSRAI